LIWAADSIDEVLDGCLRRNYGEPLGERSIPSQLTHALWDGCSEYGRAVLTGPLDDLTGFTRTFHSAL
jgi:hypothetical protein